MSIKGAYVDSSKRDLAEVGLRVTNQRAIILDIIKRSKPHLDADEIYKRARKKEPRISLSTVYRSLLQFKKKGLIEEYHFDDDHHHYEVKPSSTHHHLVCLTCGKVIEFDYDLARQIKKKIPETAGFNITEIELRVGGLCSECSINKE